MGELRNPHADRWDLDKGRRELGLITPFPRGITFADLDTETEIRRQFLNIEGKREREPMQPGQLMAYRQRVLDGRTVLLIYGDPPYDVRQMCHFRGGEDPVRAGGCVPASLEQVIGFCFFWARWADRQPWPEPRPCNFDADDAMERISKLWPIATQGVLL